MFRYVQCNVNIKFTSFLCTRWKKLVTKNLSMCWQTKAYINFNMNNVWRHYCGLFKKEHNQSIFFVFVLQWKWKTETPEKQRRWCLSVWCGPHQDSKAFEQRIKNRGQEEEFPALAFVWQRMSSQVEQKACNPCSHQGLSPQTTGWQHMAQQPSASIPGINRAGKRRLLPLLPLYHWFTGGCSV